MFKTNTILPKRFFMAKIENRIEIKKEKIASFGIKYETSKIPIIGKYKIKMLVNINIIKKRIAIVIYVKVLIFFRCRFS